MSTAIHDPAWLDRQYNALAAVPDAPAVFSRWAALSATARTRTKHELDVRYGLGPTQTLDWFSACRQRAPVLVFIHGGYWRGSDKSVHAFIAPAFVAKGCDVVMLNYDLCPSVSMTALALQVSTGLARASRELLSRGGDPTRVVVAGHSAGAHLAAMMLACDWRKVGRDLPADLVTRALAISGLFDLEPLRHAPFLKDDLRLDELSARRLSPAYFPAPAGRVLNAALGGLESAEFHRQTQLIAAAWGRDTVPVTASIEGRNHFTIVEDLATPGKKLHDMACGLLSIDH